MGGPNSVSPAEVDVREVSLKAGRARLRAVLAVPASPCGWVIFAHEGGNSLHGSAHRGVARGLNQAGLATLSMELLAAAEAADRKKAFAMPLLAERLMAGAEWLGVESGAGLGCFGAGEGAAAALWASAEGESGIESLVACAPRLDLASERLGKVRASTLLIVGGADRRALKQVRWTRKRLACSEVVVVPGATRLFDAPAALRALADRSVEWFKRTVSGDAEALEEARGGLSRESRRRLAAAASLLMLGGFILGPKTAAAAVSASWDSASGHLGVAIPSDGDQATVTVDGSQNVVVLDQTAATVSIANASGPVPAASVQSIWCDIDGLNGGSGGPGGDQRVDFRGVTEANGFVAANFTIGGDGTATQSDQTLYKIGFQLGNENDTGFGSSFGDFLNGGGNDDAVFGGEGSDRIDPGGGTSDVVDAGAGDDNVIGGAAFALLEGGPGNDTVAGGDGDDTITDTVGNNSINAGADRDSVVTGPGDDTIAGGGGNDTIHAGDGDNSISGGTEDDSIVAGAGADILNGNDQYDTLEGGAGNDSLNGGAQTDLVRGGDGDDTINASTGDDTLDGGPGTDRFIKGHPYGAAAIDGAQMILEDSRLIFRVGGGTPVSEIIPVVNCEIPVLNGGGNYLQYGNLCSDTIDAGAWTATLGAQLSGGDAGNDILIGTAGPDTVIVNFGQDAITPGAGNDVLALDVAMDSDTLAGNQPNTVAASVAATLAGAAGDTLTFTHNAATPLTFGWDLGGFENLSIVTASGADTIDLSAVTAGSAAPTLSGNDGDDLMTGSPGNDVLNGDGGADTLNGGAGDDRYVFGSTWGVDTISDSAGSDTADFSGNNSPQGVRVDFGGSLEARADTNEAATGDAIENVIGGQQNDWIRVVPSTLSTLLADGGGGDNNRLTYESAAAGVPSVSILSSGNDTIPNTMRGSGVRDVMYLRFAQADTAWVSNARIWRVFE